MTRVEAALCIGAWLLVLVGLCAARFAAWTVTGVGLVLGLLALAVLLHTINGRIEGKIRPGQAWILVSAQVQYLAWCRLLGKEPKSKPPSQS